MAEWIEEKTGCTKAWWVHTMQQLISDHSQPSDDPNHDESDVSAWLKVLVDKVVETLPPEKTTFPYDGNIRAAATLAYVAYLWASRIHRAKTMDSRRPLILRRQSYHKWLELVREMSLLPIDESQDAVFFPGQPWQSPFDPHGTNGDFV